MPTSLSRTKSFRFTRTQLASLPAPSPSSNEQTSLLQSSVSCRRRSSSLSSPSIPATRSGGQTFSRPSTRTATEACRNSKSGTQLVSGASGDPSLPLADISATCLSVSGVSSSSAPANRFGSAAGFFCRFPVTSATIRRNNCTTELASSLASCCAPASSDLRRRLLFRRRSYYSSDPSMTLRIPADASSLVSGDSAYSVNFGIHCSSKLSGKLRDPCLHVDLCIQVGSRVY